MSQAVRAGDFRVCGYCGSRNKSVHRYCVRCAAPLDAHATGAPRTAAAAAPGNKRLTRFLLAAGVMAAVIVGLMVRSMLAEMPEATEDVRADSVRTLDAPAPPPPVSGWYPGANVPVEPDTAPTWSAQGAASFPVARPNPYDVPGDPNASMVGIAPSSPRVRAALNRKKVFTEQDLLATRGSAWSTPAPDVAERQSKLSVAESRVDAARMRLQQARAQRGAVDEDHLREAIEQAADDLEDAEEDAAKARRKLAEERREQ
jgi:hypothetical protein